MSVLPGYWPIRSSRGLVIYKNGQLYESSVTLDFMLLTETQSAKFTELLNTGTGLSTDVSNIGFWADGHLPTNPIYTPAPLSVGLTLAAGISPICSSPFLQQVIPNVGDEIMIKSIEAGSAYGIGFRNRGIVDSHRITISMEWDDNGTRRSVYPGQQWTVGVKDNYGETEYWRFFFGVMMDRTNQKAYPFVVHGTYYLPYQNYDGIRVQAPLFTDAMYERLKRQTYMIFNNLPPEPVEDPYDSNNYGPGENQGGDGNGDDTSDTIVVPASPALTVSSSRFVTIYTPSAQQIEDLAGRLIDPTVFQSLANAVEDISSCVIGLHIVPLVVPYTVPDRQVCCNFMGISIGLGVYLNRATSQFLDVDCGSLDIEEYWGNCLDYAPYTQISLFLPFCGFYDLDVDEVMGKTIKIKYRVDIASGSCMASILVNDSVMYQYSGNCSQQIPVSSVDFNSFLANAFNVAVATATSGAAVAAAGSAVLSAGDSSSPMSTNQMDSAGAQKMAMAHYDTVKMRAEGRIAGSAVNAVMNSKPHYNHGGSLSGSTGFLGCKKPYLIIKRPNPMIPDMYGKFHGYPCNTTVKLDDVIGYTEVADIRLNIPDATVDEIIECERLLKDGVVL